MKLILDYILSAIYLLYFGTILILFHGIQYLCFELFGQRVHQKSVEWLNFFITHGWYLTGSTIHFYQQSEIPDGRTKIFISNHQSMFDIPGIIWFLRRHTPLFVSKIELAKGIPSISYNLRVGKAALIDRKDPKQAITEIAKFGRYVSENKFSAVIFPEGTRSRTGELRPFSIGGVSTLMKRCPGALVVPLAIENTGRFNPKGVFPLRSFTRMSWTTLEPIEVNGRTPEEVVALSEQQIRKFLEDRKKH